MADILSRRDFFKLGKAATLGLVFGGYIDSLTKARYENERGSEFVAWGAKYKPFFEEHLHRDSSPGIIKFEPNYLFLEDDVPVTETTLKDTHFLLRENWYALKDNGERVDTGRFIDDGVIDTLANLNGMIVLEGIEIPPDLYELAAAFDNISTKTTGVLSLSNVARLAIKEYILKKPLTVTDIGSFVGLGLLQLWGMSDDLGKVPMHIFYTKNPNNPLVAEGREIASRFNAMLSFTHKEDIRTFMRTIFMSLKLMLTAEQNPNNVVGPKIAYRMGVAHSAVTDMVQMGRGPVTALLEIYPDSLLRKIIEHNVTTGDNLEEKIESFCTTLAIPVPEALNSHDSGIFLRDTQLETYLKGRLVKAEGN